MRTPEERLAAGLEAYVRLQHAFDPSGAAISELRASGVGERRIANLYPLDFDAYLPQLQALLAEDWALTKQVVETCYARGKLSLNRIELSGLKLAGFEEFHDAFDFVTSDVMNPLFKVTLKAYTENLTWFPMPSVDRTELEQAHAEVEYLMRNFALSAWLLANWNLTCTSEDNNAWVDSSLSRGLQNDILDVTLGFFEHVWKPLLQAKTQRTEESTSVALP